MALEQDQETCEHECFHIVRRQRGRMQEPEPFDRERARSGLTAITGPSLRCPPGADRVKGQRGDFMMGSRLGRSVPEIHGDDRPIKLNLRKGLALLIYLAEAQGAVARDVIATAACGPRVPRDRPRAVAAHASSHRAYARPACFRDRPHQRAVVSGGPT